MHGRRNVGLVAMLVCGLGSTLPGEPTTPMAPPVSTQMVMMTPGLPVPHVPPLSTNRYAGDQPNVEPARLLCDQPVYDFGEAANNRSIAHEFVLRNVGETPVNIKRVASSCGCTVATASTNAIGPGQQIIINAVLDLTGRTGPQEKPIAVETDDPVTPSLNLSFKGVAVAELTVDPLFLNFGEVAEDVEAVKAVTVVSRRPGVSITNVVCESKAFAASIWKKGDSRGLGFDVRTVPPLAGASTVSKITVQTDHPTAGDASLQVYALVRGEVVVAPREIVIRRSAAGPLTRSVLLRAGTAKDFKVLSADLPVPGVEVDLSNQGAGSYRIDVRNLKPGPDLEGTSLKIKTDLAKNKEILIPIRMVQ